MEILRIAENITSDGIEVSITIPGSHEESECEIFITDLGDSSISSFTENLAGGSEYTFYLNKKYDNSYRVEVFLDSEIIFEESYDVVRPYVNPNTLGTTASEVAEYKALELVARSIVDTIITDGFYNNKKVVQCVGQGTDYLSLWTNSHKVLKVYENNVLVFDAEAPDENIYDYTITLDGTAVQRVVVDQFNRSEIAPPNIPVARGDLAYYGYRSVAFPSGYDYTLVLDLGYKTIPSDVTAAVTMLIEDIKCGKLDYFLRSVTAYNTDQFRIQFDKSMFNGTGNLIVDKILDKYSNTITKPGLL